MYFEASLNTLRKSPRPDAPMRAAPEVARPPSAVETGYLLRLAYARAVACLAVELPPGRTPRHRDVLATLAALGAQSQHQLAERLAINRTIMVGLIDQLEQAGLVERRRDPADRRAYALEQTERGRTALAEMRSAAGRADLRLTAALSTGERSRLDTLLGRIASSAREPEPKPDVAADRQTIQLLDAAYTRVRRRFAARLSEVGLTPPLYGTLRTLAASGPTSQQAIADRLGLSGTAILQSVDRLEAEKLVHRDRNPVDRRAYALRPTPRGYATLRRVGAAVAEQEADLDAALGGRPHRELRRLLTKLSNPPSTKETGP